MEREIKSLEKTRDGHSTCSSLRCDDRDGEIEVVAAGHALVFGANKQKQFYNTHALIHRAGIVPLEMHINLCNREQVRERERELAKSKLDITLTIVIDDSDFCLIEVYANPPYFTPYFHFVQQNNEFLGSLQEAIVLHCAYVHTTPLLTRIESKYPVNG